MIGAGPDPGRPAPVPDPAVPARAVFDLPERLRHRARRTVALLVALALLPVVSALEAATIGQADINVSTVSHVVIAHLSGNPDPAGVSTFQDNMSGSSASRGCCWRRSSAPDLAVVGAVMQTVVRNPMADPYLLGISSGAAFGAVLVLVVRLGAGAVTLPIGAFLGALGAFALVVTLGSRKGMLTPIRMVLAGVAIAQLLATATSLVVIWVNNPHATQQLEFWLAAARWQTIGVTCAVLVVAMAVFLGRHALWTRSPSATTPRPRSVSTSTRSAGCCWWWPRC